MSVGKICARDVDVCEGAETVRAAAQRMHDRQVGTLVVLGREEKPIGIVTDRDLAIRVVAPGRDPVQTLVRDVMSDCPRIVREDADIETALGVMRSGPFRRLPVVDANGQLVGLLSVDDILAAISHEFVEIGQLLRRESPAALAVP